MKHKHKPDKTVDDITRDQVIELAEAAIDLLAVARLMHWVKYRDNPEEREALDRMENALNAIGLRQMTYEEYRSHVEAILKPLTLEPQPPHLK